MSITDQEQYIEFQIANENYAIQISEIHEVIKMQEITGIPNCHHYVKGVINLRGTVIPVINLRTLFAISEMQATKQTRIIVVNHLEESVGIIVDRVNRVATFSDIQPPPERIGSVSGAYFTGIGLTEIGLVGLLKLDKVLLHE